MFNYCITCTYDGTRYRGFQLQAGKPREVTIQQRLEEALCRCGAPHVRLTFLLASFPLFDTLSNLQGHAAGQRCSARPGGRAHGHRRARSRAGGAGAVAGDGSKGLPIRCCILTASSHSPQRHTDLPLAPASPER